MMEPNAERRFDTAVSCLTEDIRLRLLRFPSRWKREAQEVRLRVNRPVMVYCRNQCFFVTAQGCASERLTADLPAVSAQELNQSFHTICDYSVYSHQEELKHGFVTMTGGHRVGLCGTAVLGQGRICGIRDLSGLNIRIARQIPGAADELLSRLGEEELSGLLLAGAPSSGKTTLLPDLARQLSLGIAGRMKKITVVDERGELAGMRAGQPQNDLGLCDVLDGYPKGEGILQAVRVLSPDLIICDEVGGMADIAAIAQGLNAGVGIIASVHAGTREELRQRGQIQQLLETRAFHKVILLCSRASPGSIAGIYPAEEFYAEDNRLHLDPFGGGGGGLCTVPQA